ncbi:DUF1871 family protein [Heyndrickxia acidicola]|uniref:DUF1871 family protein n=1 Tax=Heyndrickxia acidicola TaxID=209389 RepID=A0ABU6MPM7_9BACI|nr:DUF1871 family protein [Heyndrickxia acidicola]MED1205926.1 DUF1871 family protein [Heyndrickxia acidicola]
MNTIQETNIKLRQSLEKWDPLNYGEDAYETEIVDVIQTVHGWNGYTLGLAQKIQDIYEFSFEELIPLEECEAKAAELLIIVSQASCEL